MNEALRTWATKFGQAWTACMVCMVQGDLTVLNINHALTASKTGALAGIGFVLAVYVFKNKNKWAGVWLTGLATMLADLVIHPTHFGPWWAEAAATGIGAAGLCLLLERNKNGS